MTRRKHHANKKDYLAKNNKFLYAIKYIEKSERIIRPYLDQN